MEQKRIYKAAEELLRGIADKPDCVLTIAEKMFLYNRCTWLQDRIDVRADFSEADLKALLSIVTSIQQRKLETIH